MSLPQVRRVAVNDGRRILGQYVDEESVFHVIDGGVWNFHLARRHYRVDARCLILLPPRVLHVVEPIGAARGGHWVIHFDWPTGRRVLGELPPVVRVGRKAREEAGRLFEGLRGNWREAEPCPWMLSGWLLQLLSLFRRHRPQAEPGEASLESGWPLVERALEMIHGQYRHPELNIKELSGSLGVTQAHLCRAFGKAVRMTPGRYLLRHRIAQATVLLLNSDLNCGEVALRCGFSDPAVFNKAFRRLEGIPPLGWRRRHARGED